jgi:hypothetical protein
MPVLAEVKSARIWSGGMEIWDLRLLNFAGTVTDWNAVRDAVKN